MRLKFSIAHDLFRCGLPVGTPDGYGSDTVAVNLRSFDPAGLLTAERDATGFWDQLAYDPVDRLVAEHQAPNGSTHYLRDLAGQVSAEKDGLGLPTYGAYDRNGRLGRQRRVAFSEISLVNGSWRDYKTSS
jgi:YD repeat-containing protein